MSIRKRHITLGDALTGQWFMHPSFAPGWYPSVLKMLSAEAPDFYPPANDFSNGLNFNISDNNKSVVAYFISDYGEAAPPEQAPPNSVAIISLKGLMTNKDQYCGPAGTDTKNDLLTRCFSNPNIIGVVLDIDSGGGQTNESFNSALANASIPVIASITGWACSAAYWSASCCQEIFISGKMSQIGSIGSYIEIADFRKYYEQQGIDIIRVYAPQSTLKNKAYEDLLKGDNAEVLKELKQHTNFFIDAVKANRSKVSDDGKMFKGQCYFSEEALTLGLADMSGDLKDAILRVHELAKPQQNNLNNNNLNNNTMFGKFSKLSALKGKKAEEINEEMLQQANAELVINGITQVTVVSNAQLEEAETTITELTSEKTTLQASVKTLTEENKKLKSADGAEAIEVGKTKDEVTEDPAKVNAAKIANLPHNKFAAELIG